VDCVSVANNHIADYGFEGLRDTLTVLDRAGIAHAGAGLDRWSARARRSSPSTTCAYAWWRSRTTQRSGAPDPPPLA
jgi:hypothetical protein